MTLSSAQPGSGHAGLSSSQARTAGPPRRPGIDDADRSPATWLAAAGLIGLMAIGSVVMWVVNPLFWLWLASQLEKSSQPSLGPYLLVLFGIPLTMLVVGKGLSRLNHAYARLTGRSPEVRARMAWLRSLRGERGSVRARTVLDVVMVCSVTVAATAFLIWFFGFAGSSLPK